MRMLLLIALAACAVPALAERADKDQPTIIEADRGVFDELKQVNVVTGRATLTRGTMRITPPFQPAPRTRSPRRARS